MVQGAKHNMRILFMGASSLGFECCEAIIKSGHTIAGIFTLPQEFDIKYRSDESRVKVNNYLFKDFKYFEETYMVPVIRVQKSMSQYYEEAKKFQPDLILVIGWYYMIPDSMMALASKGTIGIHGSLLPKYRGNAPFVWAIINGEKETGVSLFYFEKGVDEGDIIAQRKFNIGEEETIKDVLEKAQSASIEILLEFLPLLANDTAPKIPQDHSEASIYPKRTPEDGIINWDWDTQRIRNFIRAQTKPYPGAFTIINNKKVVLWDADITDL
ncbi:MAG: methionyl-tRNA formyltransferase [Chitinophagaceae bacterium]